MGLPNALLVTQTVTALRAASAVSAVSSPSFRLRRLPHVDKRGLIKSALKTSSREVARARRDSLAEADDLYWSALASSRAKGSNASAVSRYRAAKARAFARGFIYTPVEELSVQNDMMEVIDRIRALEGSLSTRQAVPETDALLGTAPKASIPISEAFELYCDKISIGDQKGKSPDQRRNWRKVKARAVKNFIQLRGDICRSVFRSAICSASSGETTKRK